MIFYTILTILLYPLTVIYVYFRGLVGKEDFHRINERFAKISIQKPEKKITWIHAVSVGETNSALILLDEILKQKDSAVLFTTTTINSAKILAKIIPSYKGRLIHQFFPLDSKLPIQRFLNFWQPQKAIFIESEIWPNFIQNLKKRQIPTFLVNARISQKSFSRWNLLGKFGVNIFSKFDKIFCQAKMDRKKFENLAGKKVFFYGNLKSQAQTPKYSVAKLNGLKNKIGNRKFWLAASTHKGEEQVVINAHKKLKQKFPDLLTIIVPRHPNRADEIISLMTQINFSQRSKKQTIKSQDEIYLADTIGEMGLFYKLCDFAFVGASLVELGGHNPFEAIKLDCAILTGKYIFNFNDIYKKLLKEKACVLVKDETDLVKKLEKFLLNQDLSQEIDQKAKAVIAKSDEIAQKIIAQI